ncbi:MAG: DEAD/DEAH box helicase [Nitrospinae bacterium]|nr:DEAD/DEAH box helicase [Nitrospinota bacterium]
MTISSFSQMGLIEPLLRALNGAKYEHPTPIQAQSIPYLLEGRDLLGCAQTGTGKTAAFALPTLQKLAASGVPAKKKSPRALILTPTRELADQINQSFRAYGRHLRLFTAVVYGGVGIFGQARALERGVDILVATPGRLLDLMNQRLVFLDKVEIFTLDEVDRMLDMGFVHDVKKIIAAVPSARQSLFFSATMPSEVARLAHGMLKNPVEVKVAPVSSTAEKVEQKTLFVEKKDKEALLLSLFEDEAISRALVFTRTKHKANNIAEKLNRNMIRAEAIHGNKSQGARTKALENFSKGHARVLVATDIASRGIDIKGITHVINFEMPNEPEVYVHRIGRTARAGAGGSAISLCDSDEKDFLRAIERVIRAQIPVDKEHPFHPAAADFHSRPIVDQAGGRRFNSFRPRSRGGFRPGARAR